MEGATRGTGVSRMHTAAELGFPEPRKMATRPVDSMASMILEGGSVPFVVTSFDGMEKEVSEMPGSLERALEMSAVQESQVMGTEKVAS